jgi:hypothetical protein
MSEPDTGRPPAGWETILGVTGHNIEKGVTAVNRDPLNLLVGGTGFEPVTSTV